MVHGGDATEEGTTCTSPPLVAAHVVYTVASVVLSLSVAARRCLAVGLRRGRSKTHHWSLYKHMGISTVSGAAAREIHLFFYRCGAQASCTQLPRSLSYRSPDYSECADPRLYSHAAFSCHTQLLTFISLPSSLLSCSTPLHTRSIWHHGISATCQKNRNCRRKRCWYVSVSLAPLSDLY